METTNYGHLSKNEIQGVIEGIKKTGFSGNIFIQFKDLDSKIFTDRFIEIYNTVLNGCIFMKENISYIELDEESSDYSIAPDHFRIVFTKEFHEVVVGNDAFRIDEIAEECKRKREDVALDIAPELEREAFRIAKAYGIRYSGGKFTVYNTDTLMGRLETALKKGELRMDLPSDETSIHTVRAYCGILRQMHNKPVRCRVNGSSISVYFRNPTTSELLRDEIKDRIQQGENILSKEDVIGILDMFDIHFTDVFQEYIEFMSPEPIVESIIDTDKTHRKFEEIPTEEYDVRIDQEYSNKPTPQEQSETNTISETNSAGAVREVDGLQQYYIAELESEETKTETDEVFYDPNDF